MNTNNIQLTSVTIKGSKKHPILLDIRTPENVAHGTLLFLHGFKGFKDWGTFNLIADYFANLGFRFVKFNFSYNGGTIEDPIDFPDEKAFGENNLSTELNDLACVIDYLEEQGMISQSLAVIGHSRGGGIAILGAAEDERITHLSTLAAVADFGRRMPDFKALKTWQLTGVRYILNRRTKQNLPQFYQFVEDYNLNKSRLDIQKAARSLDIPYLIVHGKSDETVSIDDAVELKNACPSAQLLIIEDANHTFNGAHPYPSTELPLQTLNALEGIYQFLLN